MSTEGYRPGAGHALSASVHENERRREYEFRAVILSHLLKTLKNSLEESGFDDADIDQFTLAIAKFSKEDQLVVLAVPYEIRERFFKLYREKIEEGVMTAEDAAKIILETNKRHGFTLGYHISPRQIPKALGKHNRAWNIQPSEFDDRDETKMAYYSEDYMSRYKKKGGKYLYVVRAETGENSSHKRDQALNWSRAPTRPQRILDSFVPPVRFVS